MGNASLSEAFLFGERVKRIAWLLYDGYFHGQGIMPLGFFTPRRINDSSQLLGFLAALFNFEVVMS